MAITPEQARAELERRRAAKTTITPEQARAELERRARAKEPGFLQSTVQAVANPFLRFATSAMNVGEGLAMIKAGDSAGLKALPQKQRDFGYLGKARGIGGTGSLVGDIKDSAGVALETSATLLPAFKAAPIAKATLGGKILQGAKIGAKTGLVGGTLFGAGNEMQKEDSSLGSIATSAAVSGVAGGVGGALLGGILPAPIAAKNAPKAARALAPEMMTRVARVSPTAQQRFKTVTGKTTGEYLVERGIYGNEDEIMQQLAVRMTQSKKEVDDGLAKLTGQFKNGPVDDMIKELAERELRVSSPNVPSKNLARVQELAAKNDATGLTMSEVNEIKRLYERNVKLGYLKANNAEAVEKATSIDEAVREWQIEQAKDLGFTNLRELNKETQAAKILGDELWKTTVRKGGNNALSLTDAVLLAGGDPSSLSMFLARRAFSSKNLQSNVAKKIAPQPTVGTPKAVFSPATQATQPPQRTVLPQSSSSTLPPAKPQSSLPSGQIIPGTELVKATDTALLREAKGKTVDEFIASVRMNGLSEKQQIEMSARVAEKNGIKDYASLSVEEKGMLFEQELTDIWKKANEQSALPKADMFAASMAVNPNEEGDPDVKNILAAIAVGAISRKTPKAELLAMLKKLEKERVRLINSPAKNPKAVAQVEHGLARLNDTVKRLSAQL